MGRVRAKTFSNVWITNPGRPERGDPGRIGGGRELDAGDRVAVAVEPHEPVDVVGRGRALQAGADRDVRPRSGRLVAQKAAGERLRDPAAVSRIPTAQRPSSARAISAWSNTASPPRPTLLPHPLFPADSPRSRPTSAAAGVPGYDSAAMTSPDPPIPPADRPRRFRILDLLGSGGYGNVYRARMERADGFRKIVAVKLLHDRDVPEPVLHRFRDEARLLGLISDRAIVRVDAITQLDGRWAIVMECVVGATVDQLLANGLIPPKVALTVVGEITRALHKVYHQTGEGNQPLQLVHRDLKASNVVITAEGDLKLLDFGIARAQFDGREAATSAHTTGVYGTIGYIAPERFDGREGPAADVYSLGVMLYVMITAAHPTHIDRRAADDEPDPVRAQALRLALEMSEFDPMRRPVAREVLRRCASIVSSASGPSLAAWAAQEVPAALASAREVLAEAPPEDTFSPDTVLVEGPPAHNATIPRRSSPPPPPQPTPHPRYPLPAPPPDPPAAQPPCCWAAPSDSPASASGSRSRWERSSSSSGCGGPRRSPIPRPTRPAPPPRPHGPPRACLPHRPIHRARPPARPPETPAATSRARPDLAEIEPHEIASLPFLPPAERRPTIRSDRGVRDRLRRRASRSRPSPGSRPAGVAVRFVFDAPGVEIQIDGATAATAVGTATTVVVAPGLRRVRLREAGSALSRKIRIGGAHGNTQLEWSGDALIACRPRAGQDRCAAP